MAYATCNVYATKPAVDSPIDGIIRIKVGDAGINLHPDEAVAVRDALSQAITECATAAARRVTSDRRRFGIPPEVAA